MRFLFFPAVCSILGLAVAINPRLPTPQGRVGVISQHDSPLLDSLLNANPRLEAIVAQADELGIQIVYTQINRDARNHPSFTRHAWHVDSARYFNPASLVKLPIAIAALEKLHRYESYGVTVNTPMATGVAHHRQTAVRHPRHPNPDRVASVGNYIKRMLLVSDNEAYNRLYEFVGQQDMHQRLAEWGLPQARIINRFAPGYDTLANRHTNPVTFLPANSAPVHQAPAFNPRQFVPPIGSIKQGKGYQIAPKQIVNAPYDFTYANYLTLDHTTTLLKGILFPDSTNAYHLSPADRKLLVRYLGLAPHESRYTLYNAKGYFDCFKKYLYYGHKPKRRYPTGDLRSFNIVGLSHGYIADCAYFAEPSTGTEFMLSTVLYVNQDGILNDGRYEYETIGWPFLQELGQAVYAYEKKRYRLNSPDLRAFRF
jgi:hypothetical protein